MTVLYLEWMVKDTAHIYFKNIKSDDVVYAMGKGGELGFNKTNGSL